MGKSVFGSRRVSLSSCAIGNKGREATQPRRVVKGLAGIKIVDCGVRIAEWENGLFCRPPSGWLPISISATGVGVETDAHLQFADVFRDRLRQAGAAFHAIRERNTVAGVATDEEPGGFGLAARERAEEPLVAEIVLRDGPGPELVVREHRLAAHG